MIAKGAIWVYSRWLSLAVPTAILLSFALPASVEATFPGQNGLLAHSGAGSYRCSVPGIYVMRPDGRDRHRLTRCPRSYARQLATEWSPDGRRLAYILVQLKRSRVAMLAANGRSEGKIPFPTELSDDPRFLNERWKVSWSPDGRKVLATGRDRRIWLFSLDDKRVISLGSGVAPRWSPDGTRIAFITKGRLALMDAASLTVTRRWRYRVRTVDWSPDSRRLLGVGLDGRLIVLDRYGTGKRRVAVGRARFWKGRRTEDAVWSPDARYLAFVTFRYGDETFDEQGIPTDEVISTVWVVEANGGQPDRIASWSRLGDASHLSWQALPTP